MRIEFECPACGLMWDLEEDHNPYESALFNCPKCARPGRIRTVHGEPED